MSQLKDLDFDHEIAELDRQETETQIDEESVALEHNLPNIPPKRAWESLLESSRRGKTQEEFFRGRRGGF